MSNLSTVVSRLLAVLALAAAAIALIVVIGGATGNDDPEPKKAVSGKQEQKKKPKTKAKTYEVKEGDSLSAIADRTGVPVDRLEKLNPDLDPQALTIGQKLKLR